MAAEKVTRFHGCQMATSQSVKQHKLRKLIAYLSEKEGAGMEFISLYIPQASPIDEVVALLKKEADSAAANPQNTREINARLQNSLKNVIQHLKPEKEIPLNGLAIFAGTFPSDGLENEVVNVEEVTPPEPIATYLFRVDDHFHLEPLREMLRNPNVVGILTVDTKEASFGLVIGERFEVIGNLTSGIPGKTGKGGSSQRRYERERDMDVSFFFHRVAEHAAKDFLEDHKVTALIVGGPGLTKEAFLKGDYLNYELKNAVLATVDTQFAGRDAVREVFDKSCEVRRNMCAPDEKRVVDRLLVSIGKQDGLATYGLDSVLDALKKGEAEVALVTDNSGMTGIVATCKKCRLSKEKIVNEDMKVQELQEMISVPCTRCGAAEYEVEQKDIVDVLEDAASRTDATVEVISTESPEKTRLAALGGFAALLRYRQK